MPDTDPLDRLSRVANQPERPATEFSDRLLSDLLGDLTADRATPALTPIPTATNQPTPEVIMLTPNHNESPQRGRTWMLVAAAATAVLLIGGLVVIGTRSGDDLSPADTSVSSTSVDTSTATTVQSVDTAALAAVGERLVTAFDSGDAEAVAELVTDDADPIAMIGVTTKSGLIDLFGYIEAADLGFDLQECVGSEPDQVRCTIFQSSGFATAARVAPGEATMLMKIEDGQVVAMRYSRPAGHGRAHDEFSRFVSDSDPAAGEKMWSYNSEGEPYALLTEESFELFERYTQDFIDSKS